MPPTTALTQKEKELVAVAASVAAGCQPCTAHHVGAVREEGATDDEIRQAVDDALTVRSSATETMLRVAMKQLGIERGLEQATRSQRPLLGELTSIAAALAVNSTTDLEAHLRAARECGASQRQIEVVLAVTRMVKKVAAEKVDAVAATFLENELKGTASGL